MLSETFTINAVRDGNEMKIVMKEYTFQESIELPQRCWREFVGLLGQISHAIQDVQNGETNHFRASFGDGFYASVNSNADVVLEAPDGRIVLGIRNWRQIMYHLPELMSAIPDLFKIEPQVNEVDELREKLRTEQMRREEIEQELLLTKQQVFIFSKYS